MPRYFFHRMDGSVDRDETGTQMLSISEARKHAVTLAGKTLQERPEVAWSGAEFRVEVTDDQKQVAFVLRVLLDDSAGMQLPDAAKAVNRAVLDEIEKELPGEP